MSARDAAAARRGRPAGGHVATTNDNPAVGTMRQLLDQMKPQLALALPKHMTAERMARQALTAFRTTKKLDECSPQSFLGALMTCAQVGLEPGPQGYVYLIPFKNYGRMEATFILGYQGMIELARRSGQLVDIGAQTVYQNEVDQDRFRVTYGTDAKIEHDPIIFGERGAPVGYYAWAKLKDGGTPFVVLSRADVEKFRARSATQKADAPSGPWMTDYEPMAWKTCIRRLSRWLPQSAELAAAVAHEETVRTTVDGSVLDQQQPNPADAELEAAEHPAQLEGQQSDPAQPPRPAEPPRHAATTPQRAPQQQPAPAGPQQAQQAPEPDPGEFPDVEVPEPDEDDPWANL